MPHVHTHIYTAMITFSFQRLCLVWLLWLWTALISTVTNPHRDPRLKNIMITSDSIFQRQSALFFFPVQWFKVQNNTKNENKWRKRKREKMEMMLDGWLMADLFYSKLVQNIFFNRRPKWDSRSHGAKIKSEVENTMIMSTLWTGLVIFNSSRLNLGNQYNFV